MNGDSRARMHQVFLNKVEIDVTSKQREMKLIFRLGTAQPDGLNINFNFILKILFPFICALPSDCVFQRFSSH